MTTDTQMPDEREADPPRIAGRTPEEAAKVLGDALVEQARNATDVENLERQAAGLAPRERRIPFPIGGFNSDAAFAAVEQQWAIATEAERVYEDLKTQAAEARATLTKEEQALRKLIAYHVEKRHKGEAGGQLPLTELDDDDQQPASAAPACQWERDHPGQRCPICRERRPEAPPASSRDHPAHAEHGDAAAERQIAELTQLQAALESRRFYIQIDALEGLADAERAPLHAWAASPGVIPPPLMLRACIAGAAVGYTPEDPIAGVQVCTRCDVVLWAQAHHGAMGIPPYPLDAFVGLDCEGEQAGAEREVGALVADQLRAEPEPDERARVSCEACDAGMRLGANGVHYHDGPDYSGEQTGATWGVCRKVSDAPEPARQLPRRRGRPRKVTP